MKFILGTKQYMTQLFDAEGRAYPATVLLAAPVYVTQVKTTSTKDGYDAVQIGAGVKKAAKAGKAVAAHAKKAAAAAGLSEKETLRTIKEFRPGRGQSLPEGLETGAKVDASIFAEGDKVSVSAISKGKGFQGVVKRHGFGGGRRSHGQKHSEREPGSIGVGGVQRVIKGMRMGGHMGARRATVQNLRVLKVDAEKNLLIVKGAVPGPRGALVEIRG